MFCKKNKNYKLFLSFVILVFSVLFWAGFFMPVLANDTFGIEAVESEIALSNSDPRSMVTKIINVALGLLSVIAVVIVIYGGFVWMTSNGEEEKVDKAKKTLKAGVIGLAIILASWGITAFVLNKLGDATGNTPIASCIDGEMKACGCGGVKTCSNSNWGSCVGSTCLPGSYGSACSSGLLGVCIPDNTQCNAGLICGNSCTCKYTNEGNSCGSTSEGVCSPNSEDCGNDNLICDSTSCICVVDNNQNELNDSCGIMNEDVCQPDNGDCNVSHGLTCDSSSCTCVGNPIITKISPMGGFCENDLNKSCSKDSDCNGGTCNLNIPNTTGGNLVTILGYNFDTYSPTSSVVNFIKGETIIEGQNPKELNDNCVNSWNNEQIIIAMPSGTSFASGDDIEIEIITAQGKSDKSRDNNGPKLNYLKYNNIVRPGLCQLSSSFGKMNDLVTYYGINLASSQAYFGSENNSILGFYPNIAAENFSIITSVPNLSSGEVGTFAKNAVTAIASNYLDFKKIEEDPQGPSISFFDPIIGPVGQYITIHGSGFYDSRGMSQVYFKDVYTGATTTADFSFPDVCLQSVWSKEQVLIKVPTGLNNGEYKIAMKIRDWDEIESNDNFIVDSNSPLLPSLCKISPIFGPINSAVSLWGEYFGTNSLAVFSRNKIVNASESSVENGANKILVSVPESSITGPVAVKRDNLIGNSLNFTVGSCSSNSDCPSNGPYCCQPGTSLAGACVNNIDDCLASTTLSSVFQWKFTTGFATSTLDGPGYSCDSYSSCPTSKIACPNSLGVCSPYPGDGNNEASCQCCCDKTKNTSNGNEDCCSPLTCANSCGSSADYGLCSGCKISETTTTSTRDMACNCEKAQGKYCQVDGYENGACLDCTALNQSNCKEHSASCCWDNGNNVCRGGISDNSVWGNNSTNIGLCPYYKCDNQDSTICASSTPVTSSFGSYSSIEQCGKECAKNCTQLLGNTNFNSCLSGGLGCCWNTSVIPSEGANYSSDGICDGGSRYSDGVYKGLCKAFECNENNACVSTPFGALTECSSKICQENQSLSPGDSCNVKATSTYNTCNTSRCASPFGCLVEETDVNRCGFCCCDPNAEVDVCSTINSKLSCYPNKGKCLGDNRGLCCGCSSDNDCVSIETSGCGLDTCCYSRPKVQNIFPEDKDEHVCRNALISIDFDQKISISSIDGNILLLEESDNTCSLDTYLIGSSDINNKNNFWNKLKNVFSKSIIAKVFRKNVIAAPSSSKVYCAVPGILEVEQKNNDFSTINFHPNNLLKPGTRYYVIVKGDENLDSTKGIKNIKEIGMNGSGYASTLNGETIYIESDENNIKFNNIYFKNSQIFEFKTLDVKSEGGGICSIDHVVVSPFSYLFQSIENDINENDNDPQSNTFNSVADEDMVLYSSAYSKDNQILATSTQYNWTWLWSIDNNQKIEFKNVPTWSNDSQHRMIKVVEGITYGEAKVSATVKLSSGNIINEGNDISNLADIYILNCKNPWPAVKSDGTWTPWEDKSSADYNTYNYKIYYCRDAGGDGVEDDLPAFSELNVINKGKSLNKVCNNNPSQACNLDNECPVGGFCLSNFLKETYFFRSSTDSNSSNDIFSLRYYLSTSAGGSLTGESLFQLVYYGNNGSSITAVPNNGYYFSQWSDGRKDNPRIDTNVTQNVAVSPVFIKQVYTIKYYTNNSEFGHLEGKLEQTVDAGEKGEPITATVSDSCEDCVLFGWEVNGVFEKNTNIGSYEISRTENGVSQNLNITAIFSNCGRDIHYNGQDYSTTQIDGQCWLAENLNIGNSITSDNKPSDDGVIEKYCYDDDDSNCSTYGGLYLWNEAMQYSNEEGSQGICPSGWHIPRETDIDKMINELKTNSYYYCRGSEDFIAKSLAGQSYWSNTNGECEVGYILGLNNSSGFNALPTGSFLLPSKEYIYKGDESNWWTSDLASSMGNPSFGTAFYIMNNLNQFLAYSGNTYRIAADTSEAGDDPNDFTTSNYYKGVSLYNNSVERNDMYVDGFPEWTALPVRCVKDLEID